MVGSRGGRVGVVGSRGRWCIKGVVVVGVGW